MRRKIKVVKETLNYVKIMNVKVKVNNNCEHHDQNNFSNKDVEKPLYCRNKSINPNTDEITGASREGTGQVTR